MYKVRRAVKRARNIFGNYKDEAYYVEMSSCGTDRLTRFQWLVYGVSELWDRRRELFCNHRSEKHIQLENGYTLRCSKCHADMGGRGEY